MTPADLTPRFRTMVDEVRGARGVRVYQSHLEELPARAAAPATLFEQLRRHAKVQAAPALQRCFFPFARLALHWETPEATPVVGGELSLIYLYDAVVDAPTLWTATTPAAERELLQSFRVIDDQPFSGRGTLAAIRVEAGTLTPGVWFFDVKRATSQLDLDYCGYLEALLDTHGFYGWQYLFADVSLGAPQHRGLLRDLRAALAALPALFPGRDYAPYLERLEQRAQRT